MYFGGCDTPPPGSNRVKSEDSKVGGVKTNVTVNKGIRQLVITIGNVNEWVLLSTFTYIPLFTQDFPSFTTVSEGKS